MAETARHIRRDIELAGRGYRVVAWILPAEPETGAPRDFLLEVFDADGTAVALEDLAAAEGCSYSALERALVADLLDAAYAEAA